MACGTARASGHTLRRDSRVAARRAAAARASAAAIRAAAMAEVVAAGAAGDSKAVLPGRPRDCVSMPAPIDFYFDFSSPYGYLAAEQVDALAARHGRGVAWRPILLGVVRSEERRGGQRWGRRCRLWWVPDH